MRVNDILFEYQEISNDELSKTRLDNARRPRLTMKHLTKLRKLRDMKAVETADHNVFVSMMYGSGSSESSGGLGDLS